MHFNQIKTDDYKHENNKDYFFSELLERAFQLDNRGAALIILHRWDNCYSEFHDKFLDFFAKNLHVLRFIKENDFKNHKNKILKEILTNDPSSFEFALISFLVSKTNR